MSYPLKTLLEADPQQQCKYALIVYSEDIGKSVVVEEGVEIGINTGVTEPSSPADYSVYGSNPHQ